ncbi:MAG TPA: AAA family ATPase [Acidimicrobiia bacterium]|jgi:class 3 adenylate cyclase|nr:AAA family ATPase [Acidimicrobiia bacterium]
MAPERRASTTATVLFTDLVASTELMARLGDAAFDDLRRAHFAGLREVFAAHGGEEIKNTGDGLLMTFGSATDALAAAVAAQQQTVRPDPAVPVPIELRVGLALGDVAFDAGDVYGTPVVEAARLVARAQPGEILTTGVVQVVAGSRAGVTFTDLGPVDLKGLPRPVPVCSVTWTRPETTPLPFPPLLSGAGRIFVGRDDVLQRLVHLRKETVTGGRRVALLGGEPGIGKTRLATALAEAAHADGTLVLAGRCDEDLGVPFQPFVEALQHYAAGSPAPRLGRFGGELPRLVPELSETIPGLAPPLRSDPETERYRLFDAVAAWLADVSVEAPVLLVIDDLHWAAKPTLLLLRHVLRSAEPLRLLVVVTYRDSEVGRAHPLTEFLADLRRLDGVERFSLTGLDRAGVSAFIEAAAGHTLSEADEALPAAVWAETEGNPFFVAEVLRHLTETGHLEQRDGRWVITAPVDELGIPEGVRDVVGRRLARLTDAANRALTVGAVAGLEFEPAVVRVAADLAEDDLISGLEEAVVARLVSEVPGGGARYRFAHALVRATLYEELSGPRRVAVHRRVAKAIEAVHGHALDDHLPALAHHCARAVVPGEEAAAARAVDYAVRAGDRALAQLAHDEAAAYYRQALEFLDGVGAGGPADVDGRRVELLIALGEAQRRAGDPDHRATLLDAADRAGRRGDPDALARAALAAGRPGYVSSSGFTDTELVAVLQAALDAITDRANRLGADDAPTIALRARLLAKIASELVYGDVHRRRRVAASDEALALARTLADPRTLFEVLVTRFFAINAPATLPERLEDTAELLAAADTIDDPQMRFLAHWERARAVLEAGDLASARVHANAAVAVADDLGQPAFRWMARSIRFGQVLLAGRLDDADRVAREMFEIGTAGGQTDAGMIHLVQRFLVLFERGHADVVEAELSAVTQRLVELPGMLGLVALLHCEGDRPDKAREAFAPIVARGYLLPEDVVWLGTSQIAAEVVYLLDDRDGAAVLLERLAPYPELFSAVAGFSFGCTGYYLGLLAATLGDLDRAVSHFSEVAARYESVGAPAHLGRTQVAWARVLLTRRGPGDVDEARRLLSAAVTAAQAQGFVMVERRAAPLLASL